MGYSDRRYTIGFGGHFPKGVKWLLISNVAIYLLFFFAVHSGYGALFFPFYLSPRDVVGSFAIWQFVTYLFLHSATDFFHILFNMLTLWMFGNDLERTWGTEAFLRYYFLCGIGAGLCVVVANYLFGNPNAYTIGASGAIFGLLLAYGMMFPDREVLFSFLFPIKAKYFVMILGAIAFLSSFAAPGGPVSHIAHLGGMIFGFVYLRTYKTRKLAGQRSMLGQVQDWYRDYKLRRARKKFQVYLRKHDQDRDRFVH
jgi:membrane associated rhomboid family serine protease